MESLTLNFSAAGEVDERWSFGYFSYDCLFFLLVSTGIQGIPPRLSMTAIKLCLVGLHGDV